MPAKRSCVEFCMEKQRGEEEEEKQGGEEEQEKSKRRRGRGEAKRRRGRGGTKGLLGNKEEVLQIRWSRTGSIMSDNGETALRCGACNNVRHVAMPPLRFHLQEAVIVLLAVSWGPGKRIRGRIKAVFEINPVSFVFFLGTIFGNHFLVRGGAGGGETVR